jgi:diacylglycerol kinase (ATP)
MRVALIHNATAGSEDHTDEELCEHIRRAGHKVTHIATNVRDLTAALQDEPCDLVVVAGGDGTVSRAACQLAGWQVPLSIVPLGTANNTAASLALPKRPRKAIRGWKKAERVPYDLAILDDGSVRQRFAEAVGWGVFPLSIAQAKRQEASGSVRQILKRNRKLFHAFAGSSGPRHYQIEIDGRDHSGEYLLVEIVNLPLIGPRLPLSPHSDPGDGWLEIVLAGPAERAALERLARTGEREEGSLRSERGRQIRVKSSDGLLHLDGRLLRHPPGARQFEVNIEDRPIEYLR